MEQEKNYIIQIEGKTLIFRTSSFKAEKSSVLHSGIYSRESSSILFASGISTLAYVLLSPSVGGPALYAALAFVLASAFMLSRKYIFREKILEVSFNKQSGTARMVLSGSFTKKTEEIALDDIVSLETGSKRFEPINKDGADFVQKISVQHGSAVPGLGEPEEFVTLSLKLNDGSERIIYATKLNGGKIDGEPELPVLQIRKFLSK
jgi:hypothetical protein